MSVILHYTYENCDNDTTDSFEQYESFDQLKSHLSWLFKARYCFEVVGIYTKDDDLTDEVLKFVNLINQNELLAEKIRILSEGKNHNEFLLKREKEYFELNKDLLNDKGIRHHQAKIQEYEDLIESASLQLEKLKKEMINDQTNFSK